MSPSSLLELPAELRNKIWDYTLTSDSKTLQYEPRTKRFDVSRIGAGLLAVCRSTSLETLYAPTRLEFAGLQQWQDRRCGHVDSAGQIGKIGARDGKSIEVWILASNPWENPGL